MQIEGLRRLPLALIHLLKCLPPSPSQDLKAYTCELPLSLYYRNFSEADNFLMRSLNINNINLKSRALSHGYKIRNFRYGWNIGG